MGDPKRIDLVQWKDLMRRLRFTGADLTERDATLCFMASRMLVIDSHTEKGKKKCESIRLEDFLEAMCHVATLKALPTEEEVASSGCADAGEYLIKLETEHPMKLQQLERERGIPWGEDVWNGDMVSFAKRLDMVICLMLRTIEEGTAGSDDLMVKAAEVTQFFQNT